jgi:hypothetical protein
MESISTVKHSAALNVTQLIHILHFFMIKKFILQTRNEKIQKSQIWRMMMVAWE